MNLSHACAISPVADWLERPLAGGARRCAGVRCWWPATSPHQSPLHDERKAQSDILPQRGPACQSPTPGKCPREEAKNELTHEALSLSRRGFLGCFIGGLFEASGRTLGPPPSQPQGPTTLEAYLDTLIPADESPSAIHLGVAEAMVAKAKSDTSYQRLLQQGCDWLDEQARQYGAAHFAALREAERERIVSLAAVGAAGLQPLIFFHRTREDAFVAYYARPESWAGVGYAGPPQPRGFMDYAQAPSRRAGFGIKSSYRERP